MRSKNWMSLFLCGLVTGVVFFLLSAVTLTLLAEKALALVQAVPTYQRRSGAFFFAVDLLMGVWVLWLYSAIRPRYGAGPTTALAAGAGWWAIKSLQSANWVGLGFVPLEFVPIPLATSLASTLGAALAGAFLYDRVEGPPTRPMQPTGSAGG